MKSPGHASKDGVRIREAVTATGLRRGLLYRMSSASKGLQYYDRRLSCLPQKDGPADDYAAMYAQEVLIRIC